MNEAYNLIKDLEPTTPQEYILKGVVNAALGQEQGSVSIKMKKKRWFLSLWEKVTIISVEVIQNNFLNYSLLSQFEYINKHFC